MRLNTGSRLEGLNKVIGSWVCGGRFRPVILKRPERPFVVGTLIEMHEK